MGGGGGVQRIKQMKAGGLKHMHTQRGNVTPIKTHKHTYTHTHLISPKVRLSVVSVDPKPACAHFKPSVISTDPSCLTWSGKPEVRTDRHPDTEVNGKRKMCRQCSQHSESKFKNICSFQLSLSANNKFFVFFYNSVPNILNHFGSVSVTMSLTVSFYISLWLLITS